MGIKINRVTVKSRDDTNWTVFENIQDGVEKRRMKVRKKMAATKVILVTFASYLQCSRNSVMSKNIEDGIRKLCHFWPKVTQHEALFTRSEVRGKKKSWNRRQFWWWRRFQFFKFYYFNMLFTLFDLPFFISTKWKRKMNGAFFMVESRCYCHPLQGSCIC